jgi:hypothetical protein
MGRYHPLVVPSVTPQLVGNAGIHALKRAIAQPDRYAFEVRSMASEG